MTKNIEELKREAWHNPNCPATDIKTPADKEFEVCDCLYNWAMEAIDLATEIERKRCAEIARVKGEANPVDGHLFFELATAIDKEDV